MWVIILFIHHFSKTLYKITLFIVCIDNEKGITLWWLKLKMLIVENHTIIHRHIHTICRHIIDTCAQLVRVYVGKKGLVQHK